MTESLTKHPLTEAELQTLVRTAFGPDRRVTASTELTDGTYNTAIAVSLDDGRDLVLKVAPAPHLRLLTHEVDLMRTEVDVYNRAGTVEVPVPSTVYADFSRTVIGTDYAFLSRVDGVSFESVRDTMTTLEVAAVRAQVATAATSLHQLTGEAYGYPLRGSASWQPTWRLAFLAMVDDILADAVALDSRLPSPPAEIHRLIVRHADTLDDVKRPALVHFDLWDGNVFVERDDTSGWHVTGLIDGERALYGDPVAELVSLGLFRELDEATLAPFAELTDRAWQRLDLYTTYLYVIMAIEGATRGWHGPERLEFEEWLSDHLARQLAKL